MKGDGPPSWLWVGEFKKENQLAKKLAKKATNLIK